MHSSELKRLPRVPFDRPVRVRVLHEGRQPTRRLRARNLSLGGMFVRAEAPPPLGAQVWVEVEWADSVMPWAQARVVWCRASGGADPEAGFGLRFESVERTARRLIETVVMHGGSPGRDEGSAPPRRTYLEEPPTLVEPPPGNDDEEGR